MPGDGCPRPLRLPFGYITRHYTTARSAQQNARQNTSRSFCLPSQYALSYKSVIVKLVTCLPLRARPPWLVHRTPNSSLRFHSADSLFRIVPTHNLPGNFTQLSHMAAMVYKRKSTALAPMRLAACLPVRPVWLKGDHLRK